MEAACCAHALAPARASLRGLKASFGCPEWCCWRGNGCSSKTTVFLSASSDFLGITVRHCSPDPDICPQSCFQTGRLMLRMGAFCIYRSGPFPNTLSWTHTATCVERPAGQCACGRLACKRCCEKALAAAEPAYVNQEEHPASYPQTAGPPSPSLLSALFLNSSSQALPKTWRLGLNAAISSPDCWQDHRPPLCLLRSSSFSAVRHWRRVHSYAPMLQSYPQTAGRTTVEEGGETVFPNAPDRVTGPEWSDCAQRGLAVKAKKGDALLFFRCRPCAAAVQPVFWGWWRCDVWSRASSIRASPWHGNRPAVFASRGWLSRPRRGMRSSSSGAGLALSAWTARSGKHCLTGEPECALNSGHLQCRCSSLCFGVGGGVGSARCILSGKAVAWQAPSGLCQQGLAVKSHEWAPLDEVDASLCMARPSEEPPAEGDEPMVWAVSGHPAKLHNPDWQALRAEGTSSQSSWCWPSQPISHSPPGSSSSQCLESWGSCAACVKLLSCSLSTCSLSCKATAWALNPCHGKPARGRGVPAAGCCMGASQTTACTAAATCSTDCHCAPCRPPAPWK